MNKSLVLHLIGFLTLTFVAALTGAAIAIAEPSEPSQDAHRTCIEATRASERLTGVAPHLLGAISTAETGRWSRELGTSLSWPWTVMAEGTGRYLPSKAAAIAEVEKLQARGIQNIDVGCMQVNLHYHPGAFETLEEAFDPVANTTYAGKFLRRLHKEAKSWKYAVALYHSNNPERGTRYRERVFAIWFDQRPHLIAAAENAPLLLNENQRKSASAAAQSRQTRKQRAELIKIHQAARVANMQFLQMQRRLSAAQHKARFEARKAKVLAEWQEMKRKRAERNARNNS